MSVTTIDPSSGEVLATYPFATAADVERCVSESNSAFAHWRQLPLGRRLDCVVSLERALLLARAPLAEMITREMGKPLRDSLAEIDRCISGCKLLRENFADWKAGREALGFAGADTSGFSVHMQPLGVVLGVMPWNFPAWQVIRFAVPALLCGNTVLLKHAPNTWGTAELLADLFRQSFPHAVYTDLRVDVGVVADLIGDSRVRGVSLTGSVRAGRAVAELAGRHLKPCVLELGGSDAYVILDDADLDLAAEVCARSRLMNGGQSCVSAKRFIVTAKNKVAFEQKFAARLQAAVVGNPYDPATTVGPLARKDLRDQLAAQVEKSVRLGARLVFETAIAVGSGSKNNGNLAANSGFYFPVTLLDSVRPRMPAFDEELFGPVAALIEAADEAEAIHLANQATFGLGSAVFSRDGERAYALAISELDAGMCFVNEMVRSVAGVPFGGVKDSGLGRELGREGCFEFCNIKTVYRKI
jgi:succinate-semialdehyde dehydrogenase/glutarate-semialdehyde dehydrogenase